MFNPEVFKEQVILIVGGAGFVGSNLAHQLLEHQPKKLLIVDNLLSSSTINIPDHPAVEFVYGSITNDAILERLPEDLNYVFHLSCYHGNQSSIANPFEDHENNTLTSLKLFDRIKQFSALQKVVYAAAGCAVAEKTYDSANATKEDAPVSLYHDSPYSVSKIIGELYGNYYFQHDGMPFVKARFQNVYGPREILGAGRWRGTAHTVWRNVTPTFIWKALQREALPLDNGGNASRDFIFVEDMAKGLMRCAALGDAGGVYNLASGAETTIKALAEMINEIAQNPTPVDLKPARDWDRSGKRFGATDKSFEQLGFKADVTIRDGLEKTIRWTKENQDFIERSIRQHDYLMRQL